MISLRKDRHDMTERLSGRRGGESGNVLIITLLILFAMAIIGSTVAMVSTMDLKISGNQRKTSEALFVAEAGLTEAIHRLSLPDPSDATIGGWTGNIAISDSEPYDPNWTTFVYLDNPAAVAAGAGSIHTTGTIQDPNQPYLEYSQPSGTNGVLMIQPTSSSSCSRCSTSATTRSSRMSSTRTRFASTPSRRT